MRPGRLFFWLVAAILAAAALPTVFFLQWRTERLQELTAGSNLIQTVLGPVEFADSGGDGPAILILHGGGGGYDQGMFLGRSLHEAGFRIIAISRPGYLRTPISSGIFPEQQADLAVVLLRILGLEKASVLAAGEAAPVGLQMALRHPAMVDRIALLAPVTQRVRAMEAGAFSLPSEALLDFVTGDMDSLLLLSRLRWRPEKTVEDFLNLETNLKPFPAFQLSREIAGKPDLLVHLQEYFQTLAPFSPRETGTRNDIVQMRGLPEIPFAEVRAPVLLLVGEHDPYLPAEEVEALRQALGRSHEKIIPSSGFLLPGYGPGSEEARQALRQFFQNEAAF
jgi:pimeloyl-ACP methyl ester carboxylesterase